MFMFGGIDMNVEGTDARSAMGGIQSLLAREAGYSVAAECLRVQAEAERLDPTLRSADHIRLHPDAWSWYQGALGEMEVGRLLTSLGSGWRVLHSVPIGSRDTDVDHILVGPNGVFALNTKHHAGRSVWVGDVVIKVGNDKKYYLSHAQSENRNVAKRLTSKVGFPVTVRSAIVVVGERSIKDIRSLDARPIAVVSSDDLLRWITTQPATASPTQLELIRLTAEEPDTWHVDPHRADNLRTMHRFERLREAVESQATPSRPSPRPTPSHPSRTRDGASAAPARKTTSRPPTRRRGTRLSSRRIDELAKAIVALGVTAVVVTMVNNGTWVPFMTSVFSALNPTP